MAIHQPTAGRDSYNGLRNFGVYISQSAINFAAQQTLPCICIYCTPKINDQQKGEEIIRALFTSIEQDFREWNKDYYLPLEFDYWCIDKNGDLACYTRNIELYIYLCEPQNYPSSLIETNIVRLRPKHLPWQRSITLKFVPNYITLEEIQNKLSLYLYSIFNLEEVDSTRTDNYRNLRLEIKSKTEYDELVNDGEVMINSHLIEIKPYFAPLRLLMCSKCNEPGHFKGKCNLNYEVCRRCGEDKSIGNHQNCIVCCQRCEQDHLSNDYRCPLLRNYRRSLRFQLEQRSHLLPTDFQIFIPLEHRERAGNNSILINSLSTNNISRKNQMQQPPFNINNHIWPPLERRPFNYYINQSTKQSIWKKQKRIQNEGTKLKEELDVKTDSCQCEQKNDIQGVPPILLAVSEQEKYQNESSETYPTTLSEVIPILSSTLNAVQELTVKYTTSDTTNKDNIEAQELIHRISESIECIKAWNSLNTMNGTTVNNLVEQDDHPVVHGVNNVIANDE
jgi:hypothetical protein